jgi:hypothetical protein
MHKEPQESGRRNLFSRLSLALSNIRIPWKITFIAMGVFSMFWVLFRVLSKPQRIDYPCVRAASPIMCSFLGWLFTMGGGIYLFKISKAALKKKAILLSIGLFLLANILVLFSTLTTPKNIYASESSLPEVNTPVGVPQGVKPGRVVWVWNPDATNPDCTNVFGDAWDLPHNTSMEVVDRMLREAIAALASEDDLYASWNSLFSHFNEKKGKGLVAYTPGEKIFIKVNLVGGHRARMDANLQRIKHTRYANSQTSPQVVLSVLRQLVTIYGVNQNNIYVGDPSKNINSDYWNLWTKEFPDVHYVSERAELGRKLAGKGSKPTLKYSDKGRVLGITEDYLCMQLEEADYLINLAALKAHARSGVTLCAKNHYGSQKRGDANHLHIALPNETPGNRQYRALVDMMGHNKLGGNTLLYVVDGLYPGPDANERPDKWQMEPFNGGWASSLFVSQDPVALESVCTDFLSTEYNLANPECSYPWIDGTTDYLLQAADPAFWPEGIVYDPENDGTPLESLGVFERWNNSADKQYALELGGSAGIEFVKRLYPKGYDNTPTSFRQTPAEKITIYPNPFNSYFYIDMAGLKNGEVSVQILDLQGRLRYHRNVEHTSNQESLTITTTGLEAGTYILTLRSGKYFRSTTIIKGL